MWACEGQVAHATLAPASATATGLIVADPTFVVMTSSRRGPPRVAPRHAARTSSASVVSPSTWTRIRSVPTACLRSRGALGHDLASVDDADAISQLVGFLEVLRGQEDRDTRLHVESPDLGPHLESGSPGRGRSSARQGTDLGIVDQRRREIEAALHPARIGADHPVQDVAQIRSAPRVRPRAAVSRVAAVRRGAPAVAAAPHRSASGRAPPLAGPRRSAVGPCPVRWRRRNRRRGPASRGSEQGAEHVDHGRLARTVGAEEAVDLPLRNADIDTVHGLHVAKTTDQVLGPDGI